VILVRFDISAADIDRGEPDNSLDCAIVRGAKRALPGSSVSLTGHRIHVNGRPYLLPKAALAWMLGYDDRETPMRTAPVPMSFLLWLEDGVAVAEGSLPSIEEVEAMEADEERGAA
jgi:hypothetical protein